MSSVIKLCYEEASEKLKTLQTDWEIDASGTLLFKNFRTKNFLESLNIANKIGAIAESANHHPELLVAWGQLKCTLYTHTVNGLTDLDFDLVLKIEKTLK
jgi:4a-hydroxytetrahydrobiopterin dehydratase